MAAAVDDGLLTEAQAAGLIRRAERSTGAADADDERFRFLNGFNDVFLALGIALVAAAFISFLFIVDVSQAAVAAGAVAVMWVLAEILIRRYRAVLPAIFISVAFTAFACVQFGGLFPPTFTERTMWDYLAPMSLEAAVCVLLSAVVFYWRFRLPFTLGTIGSLGYLCAFLIFGRLAGAATAMEWIQVFTLCAGLAMFAAAAAYDFSDPARVTRRSDCAFWLHMIAAPMITHGLLAQFAARVDIAAAMAILGGFVMFAAISLALDRRIPLVSILLYLGIAIGYLFAAVTVRSAFTVGATLLVLGAIVVTMGVFWRQLRHALLVPLDRYAFSRKLPPVRAS
ncbi:MAG: hypothetical protein GEU87_19360 [Alphaproteobacteria bacterium]|nr:hypothetical protein [Alphaproteobacteria bacterium]